MRHKTYKILDLFCGAGGCAVGYHRAFLAAGLDVEITGVDIAPQKHYPYTMLVGDAMTWPLRGYDFIHASPPCQHYSIFSRNIGRAQNHPDLVVPIRARLQQSGIPFIIENVMGSPLLNAVMLCGGAFGLKVARHRLFESPIMLFGTSCQHIRGDIVYVYGNGTPQWYREKHGNKNATKAARAAAMGIDWMTFNELSQAIPPAYTEWLGRQIVAVLEREAA